MKIAIPKTSIIRQPLGYVYAIDVVGYLPLLEGKDFTIDNNWVTLTRRPIVGPNIFVCTDFDIFEADGFTSLERVIYGVE